LRIAFTATPADGRSIHPDCRAAVEDVAGLCAELGHELFERDLAELTSPVGAAIGTVYAAAVNWIVGYWSRILGRAPSGDDLEPFTMAVYEQGLGVTGGDYLLAVTELQAFSRLVAAAFEEFDVWLSPTLAQPPLPLGLMVSTPSDPFAGSEDAANFVAFPLVVANITGAPAMSMPLYWSPSGLPIGVNFMGRYGDEATLFRLAGQLEEARPWSDRRPPVW